ncbi:dethiobiotin synthase [Leptospira sp. 96542]|nr:dethiobiotin synthase [Leptospira sp. 96542]
MGSAFFVTGTGTDVGKTFFSSLFMAKYARSVGYRYWKPIQTGAKEANDTETVQLSTGLPDSQFLEPVYRFEHPSSPDFAARREGRELDPKRVVAEIAKHRNHNVLIEGAGGVFVPWSNSYLGLGAIQESNLDVVVVTSSVLGTINHTLLTLEVLLSRFVPVVGFYMVGPENELLDDNIKTIQKFGGVSCLGFTSFPTEKLDQTAFLAYAKNNFDTKRMLIDNLLPIEDGN